MLPELSYSFTSLVRSASRACVPGQRFYQLLDGEPLPTNRGGGLHQGFQERDQPGISGQGHVQGGAPIFPQAIQHFLDRDLIKGQLGQEQGG